MKARTHSTLAKDYKGIPKVDSGYGGWFDRPAPKMRQKTREEKLEALCQWIDPGYEVDSTLNGRAMSLEKLADSTIDDLCRAAGISLETEVTK